MGLAGRSRPGLEAYRQTPPMDAGRWQDFHGIVKMSAGYDAEVAELFRDLRVASHLTEADLAQQIATPVEVVLALEQGAIYALPPWPETCRVVNAYGTLLNLDTRPLLRRIYAQLEAGVVELGPKPVPDMPVMVPPAGNNAGPAFAQAPQAAPQAPAWPNGQGGAPQASQPPVLQPQMPQAQAPQSQMPPPQAQAPLTPQPQAPLPQGSQPAAWPGAGQPAPAWPNGAAQASQPQAAQPQVSQPQVSQPQVSQPQVSQPQAFQQPQNYAPGPAPQPSPQPPIPAQPQEDASFPGEADAQQLPESYTPESYAPQSGVSPHEDAAFGAPEPEPEAKKKSPLLKWGIVGLVAAVVLVGLWIALGGSSSDTGFSSGFDPSNPVLDPDDPRSRKADRLPDNFPQ